MAVDLTTGIGEIVTVLRTLTTLKWVPDLPPETSEFFPFALVYPSDGSYNPMTKGFITELHNVAIELHIAREDSIIDWVTNVSLLDTLPKKLWEKLFDNDGTFSAISTWSQIRYVTQPMSYAGISTIGAVYTMADVKLLKTIT